MGNKNKEGGEQNPPKKQQKNEEKNNEEILDKFEKIKENYETTIQDKDKEIEKLKKQLKEKNDEVDETVTNLNDEVNEKLEQAEKIKSLQATVDELVEERAEATVDAYIQKGIILPSQKEAAKKLCLSDNDTFMDLYKDAKPIVGVGEHKSKPVPSKLMGQITNYLK